MAMIALAVVIVLCCFLAPPLVLPGALAWVLLLALDRGGDEVESRGCMPGLMVLGVVVGLIAIAIVVVGGGALEGRL